KFTKRPLGISITRLGVPEVTRDSGSVEGQLGPCTRRHQNLRLLTETKAEFEETVRPHPSQVREYDAAPTESLETLYIDESFAWLDAANLNWLITSLGSHHIHDAGEELVNGTVFNGLRVK